MLCPLTIGQMWADTWLYGSFQSWSAKDDDYKFSYDGSIGTYYLELEAETEYEFKIIDGDNYYSMNNANFTNTTTDYLIYTGNGNCKVTTGEAGVYVFKTWWADENRHFSIYFPQARLAKQKYIYFDARNETNWNNANDNADVRFWFKYYDSGSDVGSVDCNKTNAKDDWVYYALVPDNDYIGQIQLNRLNPSNHDDIWCTANIALAKDRSSSAQNCLKEEEGKENYCIYWTPQWTTYCPPMSSVDLEEDGTTLSWGGNGSSSTPYLIPTGASIKVKATNATKAVDDDNMTIYYQFKKAGTEVQAGSTTASATITASGSTGTKEAVTVEAYNYYNSTSGTHLASNEIYYEVRTPYTIAYNKGSYGTGSRASETKLKGVNFATPNSAVFTRSGYTQTGWATSDGGSQLCTLGGNYTSDEAVTLYPVWTAKDYTINLANMEATTPGTTSVDVTFDASTHMTASDPITKPTKTHYDFGGYWTSENTGATLDDQLIDADGKWIADVTGYTSNDGAGNPTWVHDFAISLYAMWTEDTHNVSVAVSPAGAGSVQVNSSNVTSVSGVGIATQSAEMTPIAAAGWKFKEWQVTSNVQMDLTNYHSDYQQGTANKMRINATDDDQTITAVFEPRYYLVGGEITGPDDGGSGTSSGMPGWTNYTDTFKIISNSPSLLATCSLTLGTNKNFYIMVRDKVDGYSYGKSSGTLGDNMTISFVDQDNKVLFYSNGGTEYTFKITAVDGSGRPTVSVERPHQVYFGTGYAGIDNLSSVISGTTGGTLAVTTSAGSLSNEDWVTYGTNVTYTPSAATGYTFEGFYTSDAYSSRFTQDNPWVHYNINGDDHVYAKFEEKSTSVTLANDGNGKVQISSTDKTSTTCGVTTTRELTAVPNDGYMFSSWTKTFGDDISISSTNTNPTTLRGQGAGATSGQTVTANFTYRWALSAQSDGWGSSEFIIGNIATVSGDVVGYVDISLAANTNYQFTMKDLLTNDIYKNGSDAVYFMTNGNSSDWPFATDKTYNCGITTAGKGIYRFTWNVTDKTVTVTYPASYQVNYGASVGGSVSIVDDDSNAVPNGGYVRSGGSVTYTATPNTGYTFVGWCGNDSYGDPFTDLNPWTNSGVVATSNAYAKFKSTNFVIYRSGDKDDDPRAALDDVESYAGGTISETIEFRMKVRDLDMWHTLCLPFMVNAVKVWDEDDGAYYDIEPYYREKVGDPIHGGHYIIRTPRQTTDLPIAEFGDWRDPISPTGYVPTKDAPYIIQWHNSYFLNKYVSFFGATGQTIPTSFSAGTAPSSNDVINVCTNNSMTTGSVAGAYMLESDYGNGAWLRLDNADESRPIPPFECYLLVNNPTRARYMAIRPGMTAADTPTGWDDVVNSEIKTHIIVYSISGVCVTQYSNCSINEAGQRLSESYGEGLYILRADNESVKLMVGGK